MTLVILGEAPGEHEASAGKPFVGPSGKLLKHHLLPLAGLDFDTFHILNVFQHRPPNSDLKNWTANKTELKRMGLQPQGAPLDKRYLLPQHQWQVDELHERLASLQPDLIIALGATALWALSGDSRIGTFRGNFFQCRYGTAIATYHPAAILRQWSNLPLAWADLRKARRHLEGTLPTPLARRMYVDPTEAELQQVYYRFRAQPKRHLGVDIETCPSIGQITMCSFAFPELAICIPLWDKNGKPGEANSYATAKSEVKAWRWIEKFAALPNPKVLQNGSYDSQYLMDSPLDIRLKHWYDDTAILQHSQQPELKKDLGTLASLYLNEPSWKQMRAAAKDAKADE